MGNLFRVIGLLLATLLVSLGLLAVGIPQDPVKKTENNRHIKMVKIVDGKKMELDTTLTSDEPFVWMGNTVKGSGAWMLSKSKKGLKPGVEESENVYEYRISGDKGGKKMVFISSDGKSPMVMHESDGRTDSAKSIMIHSLSGNINGEKVMNWQGD